VRAWTLPMNAPTTVQLTGVLEDRYTHNAYFIKRQFAKLLGAAIRIYGPQGQLLLYVEQKAFKLKEDIRVYTDEKKTREVLSIKSRHVIDFSATYDVFDNATGEHVGSLRRQGLKSAFLRDEWDVLDRNGAPFATVIEDNVLLALARRFLEFASLVPQNYDMLAGGQRIMDLRQRFNPFLYHMDIVFMGDTRVIDRRLGLAAGILLALIEGRQG
jgi:uncharacterized protein YxjI